MSSSKPSLAATLRVTNISDAGSYRGGRRSPRSGCLTTDRAHREPGRRCRSLQDIKIQSGAASKIRCMALQKDLRRPSPLIAQQGEEFPFRVELGGSAKLGQHLARNAVDTHAGPLRALAVARIGDLPKQAIMRSSFSRTALKDTSFSRLRISEAERGDFSRSTGLI